MAQSSHLNKSEQKKLEELGIGTFCVIITLLASAFGIFAMFRGEDVSFLSEFSNRTVDLMAGGALLVALVSTYVATEIILKSADVVRFIAGLQATFCLLAAYFLLFAASDARSIIPGGWEQEAYYTDHSNEMRLLFTGFAIVAAIFFALAIFHSRRIERDNRLQSVRNEGKKRSAA